MRAPAILLTGAAFALPVPALAQSGADTNARIDALEIQAKKLIDEIAALKAERARLAGTPLPAPTPAPVQQASVEVPPLGDGETRDAEGRVQVAPTALDRALQGIGSWAEISATSDSSTVSIKLGGMVSSPNLRGRPEGWATYDTWAVTGSAPFGKPTNSYLGTLDGFVNSSKLKARWSQFRVKIAKPEKTERGKQIIAQARVACAQAKAEGCEATIVGDEFVRSWLGPTVQSEYLKLAFPASLSWAYGLEGSVGYNKFSYLDIATGAKGEVDKVPWGAKAFVSVLPASNISSWTAGLEYQRTWKEQDLSALCPAAAPTPTICPTGPGGAPTRTSKLLASLEYRQLIPLSDKGFLPSLGLSAMLTYDAESDDVGVDVPIYLVPNDKGQMIGGLRFGYTNTSKGSDFTAGVFVGTSFSIFQ